MQNPTVTLVSWPKWPLETLYYLWEMSRSKKDCLLPEALRRKRLDSVAFDAEVQKLFGQILDAGIPVAENLHFTFMLEGVSISLREQMVRHRVGVKIGDQLGVDFVPDLQDSTWWSQSMRILDMGQFAERGEYRIPEEVLAAGPNAVDCFKRTVEQTELGYVELVEKHGVPMEAARDVIPLAATHRISWTLNLAALKHIIGKRGCWILQLGLWKPVILGMVEELCAKVDPIFRTLIQPPCIVGGKFDQCHFVLDNERRVAGEDKLPPCSLFLHRDHSAKADAAHGPWRAVPGNVSKYAEMMAAYEKLWGRDPKTAEVRNA